MYFWLFACVAVACSRHEERKKDTLKFNNLCTVDGVSRSQSAVYKSKSNLSVLYAFFCGALARCDGLTRLYCDEATHCLMCVYFVHLAHTSRCVSYIPQKGARYVDYSELFTFFCRGMFMMHCGLYQSVYRGLLDMAKTLIRQNNIGTTLQYSSS